ncbi:hypothetical protein BC937DRAFT_86175 [Endogone sp. FLAS-F59071]|nr:hypothetical protein BC937DRAFT_86175 [Endogone sp. FLAS-F59071]|eukprot:RUS13190.1 hypothetical protein BC937DRAFT_86175 [Endogone sp. FLAS-F59071]
MTLQLHSGERGFDGRSDDLTEQFETKDALRKNLDNFLDKNRTSSGETDLVRNQYGLRERRLRWPPAQGAGRWAWPFRVMLLVGSLVRRFRRSPLPSG